MSNWTSELFLNENFGLENETARRLYHEVVIPLRQQKGITDAHTHLSARQIVEDERFPDIWTAMIMDTNPKWSNMDHYITQLAAKRGVSFDYMIDKKVPNIDKWKAVCNVFPELAGNHVYTWAHLELKSVLGLESMLISAETAQEIWDKSKEILSQYTMTPQAIFQKANAKVICTTDDPIDDLEYHKIAKARIPWMQILPTFRPDQAMNIFASGWKDYVTKLCSSTGQDPTLEGLLTALRQRHDFFAEHGCRATDSGVLVPYGLDIKREDAEKVFNAVYGGSSVVTSPEAKESEIFISFMMHSLFEMNQEKGWVSQIHFGAERDQNSHYFERKGPNVGGDISRQDIPITKYLTPLLDKFCSGKDPKKEDLRVVLYCLDPTHYPTIATLSRVYQSVRWGNPWWFCDSHYGRKSQLAYMIETESAFNNAGMVCDGRKIPSFAPRHDLDARAVCTSVGSLVESGLLPGSEAPKLVEAMCYQNQVNLFRFNLN